MDSATESRDCGSDEVRDERKLPKHIWKDGAKWLMLPSKTMLDSLNVWPECQNNFTKVTHVYWFVSYFITIMGNFFYVTGEDVGLGPIAYSLSLLTVSIETVTRRIISVYYNKSLVNVLNKLYFEFWPSDIAGKELHNELTRGSSYLLLYCTFYSFSAFLCGMQYIFVPYFTRNLPLATAFPFKWQESPYYELLYVWQSFSALEIVFNICGLDLFFVSLLFNCVAQFKLLRHFLQINFEKAIRNNDNNKEAKNVIIVCIQRHKKLIGICNEINHIFTYFILVQYLTSMGTVCLSSFIATAVPENVGQAFSYLTGHICEILIYCYMGNDLIIESTELANTIFQCGWHLSQGDTDLQKSLVMMMVRSQRPIQISAGGFGILSLSSFLKLIQFSFSVYTLLNSLWKKQNSIAT